MGREKKNKPKKPLRLSADVAVELRKWGEKLAVERGGTRMVEEARDRLDFREATRLAEAVDLIRDEIRAKAKELSETSDERVLRRFGRVAMESGFTFVIQALATNPATPAEVIDAFMEKAELWASAEEDDDALAILKRLVSHPNHLVGDVDMWEIQEAQVRVEELEALRAV